MRLGRIQFEFESQCDYHVECSTSCYMFLIKKLEMEFLIGVGFRNLIYGEMSEWLKEAVLKTADGDEPSVGSNPTLPVIVTHSNLKVVSAIFEM